MEQVIGIGGIFFRPRDPTGLAERYRSNFGIQSEDGLLDFSWQAKDCLVTF